MSRLETPATADKPKIGAAAAAAAADEHESKSGEHRNSKQACNKLFELLAFCRRNKVCQLFDGKTIAAATTNVQLTVGMLLENVEIDARTKLENIVQSVDDLLGADNSCGATSNRVCNIFLGPDNTMSDIKKSYRPLGDELMALATEETAYPRIMRFEVSHPGEAGRQIGSHSYTLIAHNETDINLMHAYIGQYSLAEAFDSKRTKHVNAMGLSEYLSRTLDLESNNAYERGEAYTELYRDGAEGCHPPYTVMCRSEAFDPTAAYARIMQLSDNIHRTYDHNPDLKTENGFTNAIFTRIANEQRELLSVLPAEYVGDTLRVLNAAARCIATHC